VVPVVNQIETHPYLQEQNYHNYMESKGILHQARGPLGQGKNDLLSNATLKAIGDKYGKSDAQVMLNWNIARGVNVIPKSQTTSRIKENFNIFDFTLTKDDMEQIALMDKAQHFGLNPHDQEKVNALAQK
jgi:diketogulonate reductase-like aldo/keto reductase